jgi:hypothetical protein
VDPEELIARFPRLYHMADAESWSSIQRRGLLSTTALLDLFGYPMGPNRTAIEAARRPETVSITHPTHGKAVIRDNKPLSDSKLEACLDGMACDEFYRTLNSKVFFWLTDKRLRTLLHARAYRDQQHTVLTVDTASLVAHYEHQISLSPINSGSTAYQAMPRGPWTFQPIAAYDFDGRRKIRGPSEAVAELAVSGGVPDIMNFLVTAEIRQDGLEPDILWTREGG